MFTMDRSHDFLAGKSKVKGVSSEDFPSLSKMATDHSSSAQPSSLRSHSSKGTTDQGSSSSTSKQPSDAATHTSASTHDPSSSKQ